MKRILLLLLGLLYSCGGGSEKSTGPTKPSTLVTAMKVEARDVPISFEYVAQTQSSHMVNIQARVSGFLDKRVYREGSMVKTGDILFLMDKKPFQTQVEAAQAALVKQEAALENARLNLARVKPLAELNALSQKDLDDANSSFQSSSASVDYAKAELETALLNLSYCTITAPFDGITSAAAVQEGSYLNMIDSQLTTVSAITPIWVNFSLSENQVQDYRDQVEKGLLVSPNEGKFIVKVIQGNGKLFPQTGLITFSEPYFNIQTGTFLIRASVDNPLGVLRPNQYVRVRVEGAIRPDAILVPQKAVQQSAKGPYVWVINSENKAEFRPVTVGDWQGQNWFINEGLKSEEEIIVDGGLLLHAGDDVHIQKKIILDFDGKEQTVTDPKGSGV